MGFMDNVSAFAQGVGQKAKGNYDVLALNNQLSSLEKELAGIYRQLGENYYDLHNEDPDPKLEATISQITEKREKISELKTSIDDTKAATAAVQLVPPQDTSKSKGNPSGNGFSGKVCSNCGSPIGDELFCGNCGAKQEPQDENSEPEKRCIKCGSPIGDELFCAKCGAKQDETGE